MVARTARLTAVLHLGPLLNHIMKRGRLTERESSLIVRDIANGLNFLHSKGMSHRSVAYAADGVNVLARCSFV